MIYTFVPYSLEKALGDAYNACMGLICERDWAILVDHDAMFVTTDWHRRIAALIEAHPQATFAAVTNRLGCLSQRAPGAPVGDDIAEHRAFGAALDPLTIQDVTDDNGLVGGVCLVVSKIMWRHIGGFKPDGILGVDNDLHRRVRDAGRRVLVMRGVYVYHWRRGGGSDKSHLL